MTLGKALLLFAATFSPSLLAIDAEAIFQGEWICRGQPERTLCPKLSHLELGIVLTSDNEDWESYLSYDHAQVRKETWRDILELDAYDLAPQKSWLSDYGIRKRWGDRWSFALLDTDGTTGLVPATRLAFGDTLQDYAWKQTAAQLLFQNKDVFRAELLLGLGEGERFDSDDDSYYTGVNLRWRLFKGSYFSLAYSRDPDSLNRDALVWSSTADASRRGFAAERYAVNLGLDGLHPDARGLLVNLGWQKTEITRGSSHSEVERAPRSRPLDPTEALGQVLGISGSTERETWQAGISYRILDQYLIATQFSQLKVQFADAALESCARLDTEGLCVGSSRLEDSFRIKAHGYGIGREASRGQLLMLEAYESAYDSHYESYHFRRGKQRQKSLQLVQLRYTWMW